MQIFGDLYGCPLPTERYVNPAEHLLDVMGREKGMEWEKWSRSRIRVDIVHRVNTFLATAPPLRKDLALAPTMPEARRHPVLRGGMSFVMLTWREILSYLRHPAVLVSLLVHTIIVGNLYGSVFGNADASSKASYTSSVLRAVFLLLTTFSSLAGAFLGPVVLRTPRYLQEIHARWYSACTLAVSLAIVDVVMHSLPAAILAVCLVAWMDLQGSVWMYFIILISSFFTHLSFMHMCASVFDSFRIAYTWYMTLMGIWGGGAGFLVPVYDMPLFIRGWYYTSMLHYTYEAMLVHTFWDPVSERDAIESRWVMTWYFGVGKDIPMVWVPVLVLLGMGMVFRMVAAVGMLLRPVPLKTEVIS